MRCRQNLGFALQGGLPGINGRGLGYNVAAAESQRTIRALQPVRASKRDHTFETWTPNVCEAKRIFDHKQRVYFHVSITHVSLIGSFRPIGGIGITGILV